MEGSNAGKGHKLALKAGTVATSAAMISSSLDNHGPRRLVRIRLGTLDVRPAAGGGAPALLEKSGLRVSLQLGADVPVRWIQGGPATQNQKSLKYSRLVSGDGQYATRVSCEFDEEIDLPWSCEQHPRPVQLSADIWLEKRTVAERLDSILDRVGLGSDLPEFDRTWLGRAVCLLPDEGEDTVPEPWPVIAGANSNGPVPTTLTVGVEWLSDEISETSQSSDGEEEDRQQTLAGLSRASGLLPADEAEAEAVQVEKADGPCTGSGCLSASLAWGLWSRPGLCCYG